jgi:hypothetical protein
VTGATLVIQARKFSDLDIEITTRVGPINPASCFEFAILIKLPRFFALCDWALGATISGNGGVSTSGGVVFFVIRACRRHSNNPNNPCAYYCNMSLIGSSSPQRDFGRFRQRAEVRILRSE